MHSHSTAFPPLLPAGVVLSLPDPYPVEPVLLSVLRASGAQLVQQGVGVAEHAALWSYRQELERARSLVDLALFRIHKAEAAGAEGCHV